LVGIFEDQNGQRNEKNIVVWKSLPRNQSCYWLLRRL